MRLGLRGNQKRSVGAKILQKVSAPSVLQKRFSTGQLKCPYQRYFTAAVTVGKTKRLSLFTRVVEEDDKASGLGVRDRTSAISDCGQPRQRRGHEVRNL